MKFITVIYYYLIISILQCVKGRLKNILKKHNNFLTVIPTISLLPSVFLRHNLLNNQPCKRN